MYTRSCDKNVKYNTCILKTNFFYVSVCLSHSLFSIRSSCVFSTLLRTQVTTSRMQVSLQVDSEGYILHSYYTVSLHVYVCIHVCVCMQTHMLHALYV